MDIYEALYTTRAMRRVKPDPIPQDVLERIIDAAAHGPSGGNEQKWRFVLVTDPEMKGRLQPVYKECLDELNAATYSHVVADPDAQQKKIMSSSEHLAANLHEHPMLIFVFGKLRGESTSFPVLWNLCLAARAEGLGTCITTLLKIKREEVSEMLGMTDHENWEMHAMIPIGYPTGKWGVPKRRPAHLGVFSETWENPVDFEIDSPLWQQH